MEFKEVIKIRERLCRYRKECKGCPLNEGSDCKEFLVQFPEEAEAILLKWREENPMTTLLSDFLRKYPDATLDSLGTPKYLCPASLGYSNNPACKGMIESDCKKCWNRPLKKESESSGMDKR